MERLSYEHGGDIYSAAVDLDFSANLNFCGMPEAVRQAAISGVLLSERYPDPCCRKLKEALAEAYSVDSSWVVCGNGSAELLFSLALAEKPRRALLPVPSFFEYRRALCSVDCEIEEFYLREEEEFRLTERFLAAVDDGVDWVILCNPNNPTGQTIPRGLLKQIAQTCQRKGIRLLLDECFLDFLEEPESLCGSLGEMPQLFLLKAFTKFYAMPGLRLGYGLCADVSLLRRIEEVRQPWSVCLPAQMAGLAALKEREYPEESRRALVREKSWLKERLISLGFCLYGSAANYIFFRGEPGLSERLREQKILIRDCGNYRGLTPGYYRIAVRSRGENERLIAALAKETEEKIWHDRS